MNEKIFKAYDIRGVYPEELNEDSAEKIGRAFARFTGAKKIVVAEGGRVSSPSLKNALLKGILSQGAEIHLAGEATTPMFYFAVASNPEMDAGIMITASHNPAKYNGFKMVRQGAVPIGEGSGMEEIKKLATGGEISDAKNFGETKKMEISEKYIQKVLSLVDAKEIKELKIAIDAGNGMAGIILPKLLQHLPQLKTDELFFDIDMSFPNHEANPLKEETLAELKDKITENGAHLGIAYDGDADRVGFVDEKGVVIRADIALAAILPIIIEKHPTATVLYDIRCSRIVRETAEQLGGKAEMSRVGHAFIKRQMKKLDAAAAGEISSHFYFKDFFGVECSDLMMLYILTLISRENKPISRIVERYKKYFHSGEINFEVSNKEKIIEKIKQKYKKNAATFSDLDGIRLDFEEDKNWWWFNLRPSNTEPLLRLNMESNNKKLLEEKMEELEEDIKINQK